MKSKIFSFFLCFILIFNIFSFDVFAVSGEDLTDYGTWYTELQAAGSAASEETLRVAYNDLVNKPLSGFSTVIATYDSSVGVIGAGMRYFASLIKSGNTPQQALQSMQQDITENNGTISINGDGAQYIENYYADGRLNGTGSSLSSIGYVNRFIMGPDDINPDWFTSYPVYRGMKTFVSSSDSEIIQFLNTGNLPYGACQFKITRKQLLGALLDRNYWGYSSAEVALYADDWTPYFNTDDGVVCQVLGTFAPNDTCTFAVYFLNENGAQVSEEVWSGSISQLSSIDIITLAFEYASENNLTLDNRYNESWIGTTFRNDTVLNQIYVDNLVNFNDYLLFSSRRVTIPCFATLSDLKKGTVGKTTSSSLLPSYTGNGINGTISDSQITQARDIITNYYQNGTPQGGGSSDPGGGGSSGDDSGSGSLWEVLASAVKNLINFIVDVLGSAIGALTELLDKLVGFFSNARELVGSGFADFVAAFFPYLPEEWITLVSLSIGLVLFFWVLKKFT